MRHTLTIIGAGALCLLQTACTTTSGPPPGQIPPAPNRGADINTQLGIGYLRTGKLDLALDRLNKALQADPDFATAHNAIGLVYDRLNDPEKAEAHFARAVELNPSDPAARTNYGGFLCRHGRSEEGVQLLLAAAKDTLYDKPEVAYTNAGICKRAANDLSDAESYFRSALRINPRLPVALLNMAELSYEQKRYLPARAYLQRYSEVGEVGPRSLWLGVRVEGELGDKDALASYAMLLRGRYPDSRETQLLLESDYQ